MIVIEPVKKSDLDLANDAEQALKLFTERMLERGKDEGNILIADKAFKLYKNFVEQVFEIKKRG